MWQYEPKVQEERDTKGSQVVPDEARINITINITTADHSGKKSPPWAARRAIRE